jgi:hypothetical protein
VHLVGLSHITSLFLFESNLIKKIIFISKFNRIGYCSWSNSPQWAKTLQCSRFYYNTETNLTRYSSHGRVISSTQRPVPGNTQKRSQDTVFHDTDGNHTLNPNKREASEPRLRPRCNCRLHTVWLGAGKSGVRIWLAATRFVPSPKCPDRKLGPHSLIFNGYRGSFFPPLNGLVREVVHSPPLSAEVKNEWSYTFTPSIWLRGVDRNKFVID